MQPSSEHCLNCEPHAPICCISATVLNPCYPVLSPSCHQVTDAIKKYVEDKIARACVHFTQVIKEVDVTLSARGGDTGTHGKK